jgi:hypothetical protein
MFMRLCFIKRNNQSSENVSPHANDWLACGFYDRNMAAAPFHDWYLADWLETLQIKQADLSRLTDWDKRKTSFLVSGKQPYKRDDVNEAAFALNLQPFELLMPPEQAMALRRLYASSVTIAAEGKSPYVAEPGPEPLEVRRKLA